MPRPRPQQLTRPAPVRDTKTFTDPLHPNDPLTITFCIESNMPAMMLYEEKAQAYILQYLTGTPETPPQANLLPPVDGRDVPLSENLLNTIAFLETFDVPETPEDAYGFLDWRAMSVTMPDAFPKIVAWCGEVEAQAKERVKNSSGAVTEA